jgi:transcriptional regulator with XRE-family HTH domain
MEEAYKGLSLSKVLIAYRIKNGLKQKDLAQLLNVSVVSVNKWERDKNLISSESIKKISELKDFPLTMDELSTAVAIQKK